VLGRGKIITVYSPRGGSGCTMLACNLAATLVNPETRVVVVDGTLQFGDVEVFFNVQSRNTIVDLAPRVDEMDAHLVDEVLATHASGIRLLLPSRPERSELVTGPQFSQILVFLSQYYDYVIVDASHRLSDVTLAGLDTSDVVVLITTQDIPSIARTRKFLDLMPAMELDKARLLIVMNQYDPKAGIEPEKVSQAFRTKIAALVPRAIEVVVPSINRGAPFMLQKEMATRPIGRAMLEVVEAIRQRLVELDKATTEEK
jgi:pilus assembly protein CpaE